MGHTRTFSLHQPVDSTALTFNWQFTLWVSVEESLTVQCRSQLPQELQCWRVLCYGVMLCALQFVIFFSIDVSLFFGLMTFTNSMRYSVFKHFIIFLNILHVKCLCFCSEIKRLSVYESILSFICNIPILYSTIELMVNAVKFTNVLPVPLEYFGTENAILTCFYTPGVWERK